MAKPSRRTSKKSARKQQRTSSHKGRPAAARKVAPVPAGLRALTVNLILPDCSRVIAWYKEAFGAKELARFMAPDGRTVWHASLRIGDSVFFVNDPVAGVEKGGPGGQLWLYGPKVDARWARAVAAGARPIMDLWDTFWGDRCGTLVDPFGQQWSLAERRRAMTPAQMRKEGEEFARRMADAASSEVIAVG